LSDSVLRANERDRSEPPGSTLLPGTAIVLDPAGSLPAAIGGGNLRAFVDGQDDVGHVALSN
jgi:hypothetical protein